MKLSELSAKHLDGEPSRSFGEIEQIKYKAFRPILSNLYENKVI